MGKQEEYLRGRNEGMVFGLRIAEEKGIEGLREEVEFRGVTGISLNVSQSEIKQASMHMAMHSTVTAIAISIATLKEEFSFSDFQAKKFKKIFDAHVKECCDNDGRLAWYVARAEMAGITLIERD